MLYGCDGAWWKHQGGVPAFGGLKVTQDEPAALLFSDLRKLRLNHPDDRILVKEPAVIGSGSRWGGGNSGFQALNLAVQFGATRIVLVGFDMHGEHWHGKHPPGLNNPSEARFAEWRRALNLSAGTLAALGVTVINASPVSALTAFPIVPLEKALTC